MDPSFWKKNLCSLNSLMRKAGDLVYSLFPLYILVTCFESFKVLIVPFKFHIAGTVDVIDWKCG